MIRFERGDWLGQVFTFHGTIVETLWWPTLIYFVYCTIMFVVAECYALGFDENRLLVDDHGSIRFLGGFVSFLLIFQMNTSFERFTGGINLTAQFFSHLYGSLGIVLGYLRRDGPLPDGMSPDSDDWKRREREALEALATEVHVVRLVLAIGASLKFHVRIAENVLTGGRLPLETVQLLLFDLHRVRGLLLPNEQVIVDQACGLYLEHDQCGTSESGTSRNVSDEPAVQCKFRVRLNYMEDEDSIGGKTAQLEQLASSSSRNLGTEGCAGAPIPLLLVQLLRGHLAKAMETPWGFRERVVNIVEQSLSSVCTSFESLDRLITMPFPLAYLQHSKALFLLFSSVYPLCIGTSLGFWANVVSPTIIFFALLGFEVLADELENPLGSGPQDLNIIEMVHALEVRAAKAFAAAEVQREAISKDQQKFLEESLGLPSQASSSMPAATREKLERVRRFSHHFCWLSLPKHVLMDLARQDTQVPADFAKSCSVQSPRGSLLYQVYDFGGNVRQFLSRQKIRPCADYGILEGEVDATEASPVFQKYLQECVSHFVCLKSQEAAMRSICDEMQGCVRQEEPVGVDSDVEDPVVELRLAGRLTGAANRVSKWMSPGEASRFSESLSAFAPRSPGALPSIPAWGPRMQSYEPQGYGSMMAPPDQARVLMKRRRRTNILALAAALLIPWSAFAITFGVTSFSIRYQHPQLSGFVVAVVAVLILVCGVMAFKDTLKKRRDAPRESTWYIFVSTTLLLGWLGALILGNANFKNNMRPYYDITNLNAYAGVDPAKTHGQTLLDAGRVMFTRSAFLDIPKSFGFKNDRIYCVAPIVSSLDRLASYDFWAVGVDCCTGNKPDFMCANYDNERAHAGLRLMGSGEKEYYRLAVEQAQAAYGIRAETPLFFTWTEDPIGETNEFQEKGFKLYVLAVLMFFAVQLFLVVMSSIGFSAFSIR